MRGLVDYHTHSILSDGACSYEEMTLAAIEKGLDEIGFSDHVCLKPVTWAIREAAKSRLFDTLGHLDLIKKFCIYPETDQTGLYEETALQRSATAKE
jgi:histidinol phosphatase-like PHP family hydrolase